MKCFTVLIPLSILPIVTLKKILKVATYANCLGINAHLGMLFCKVTEVHAVDKWSPVFLNLRGTGFTWCSYCRMPWYLFPVLALVNSPRFVAQTLFLCCSELNL